MSITPNRAVQNWLFAFTGIVAFLILFGGFVRLTRAGLSIVEWNPISGSVPPLSHAAWEAEFAKYQQTPEFKQINFNMTLPEYQYIFWIEWVHRFIARLAGLAYALPVFYFLFSKKIPRKEFGIYVVMGLLFISQAVAGWIMVASGLVDRPSVSHFNLTVHLLLALTLFGLALWTGFNHKYGTPSGTASSKALRMAKLAFAVLILQITYGGFTAGLKAGHVSNTWPLMFGKLIPPNLFTSLINIIETPQTIVFIHRWFAFAVLAAVIALYTSARKNANVQAGLRWLVGLVSVQIILGILTVLLNVQLVIALTHQGGAVVLFGVLVYFIHRLKSAPQPVN